MACPEQQLLDALSRVGIAITPDARLGERWGWSITNAQLVQPWVGPYATRAEAADAVLAWLMHRAWRGVLCPHIHGSAAQASDCEADHRPEEDLLGPWRRSWPDCG